MTTHHLKSIWPLAPLAAALPALALGCAEAIGNDDHTHEQVRERITHVQNDDGTVTTVVDATQEDAWVYLDFETLAETFPQTPTDDASWDLGFQRFKIKSNGGISGSGAMEIAMIPEADFDALTQAPSEGYLSDSADSEDDDEDPDYVFSQEGSWYDYNPTSHTLSPKDQVYVLRSVEGQYYKLKMLDYYDAAGTSAFVSFQWGAIEAPLPAGAISVDASDAESWTYLSLSDGIVTVADGEASSAWDIALSSTKIRTNGGTSGEGLGAARLAPAGLAYDDVTSSNTVGFVADTMVPLPGPPGSGEFSGSPILNAWYDYDASTHQVWSREEVYLIRSASGDYGKFQILGYAGGVFTLRLEGIQRAVATVELVVDASDAEAWVYLNFSAGDVVSVDEAATDGRWDLGISRTNLRTNSGSSGEGAGGALEVSEADYAAIVDVPEEDFVPDAMLPLPGPPGSGEYSGNEVLATWYDYDATTHVVSPRDTVFILRSASGDFIKLQITAYDDGVLSFDWAYAGPGQNTF